MAKLQPLIGVQRVKYNAPERRFVVPQDFREALGSEVFVVLDLKPEQSRCFVFPAPRFEELSGLATAAEDKTPFSLTEGVETTGGWMDRARIDGRGRLTIPDSLAGLADFDNPERPEGPVDEIVLVGWVDRVEIITVAELDERKRRLRQQRRPTFRAESGDSGA
jgi:DNA-binding transcriptional regulator/RsmH inhibitor MraZ